MWAVCAYRVVLRRFDECDSQRRLFDPTEPLLLRGGGVCRPPGRTSESRCSSNTAQTPTMLWRGHMLMILARLVRSESFWAVVKVRSPHTGPEFGYPRQSLSDMRRVALASAALAFCLPAQWVAGASAAVACLTAATGRRLGASARLGVAIVASATRLDSTLSQELPHALARVMAHATRLNARLASRKCDRPRSRQSTAC